MYNYNFRNNMNTNSYIPTYDHLSQDRNNMTFENQNEMVGSMQLATPSEGYMRGNLFNDLYKPYKNYKPAKLQPTNARQKLFLDLSEVSFAAHELNLYLDLHPEDTQALNLFNNYRKKANLLLEKYENEYGPLLVSSDDMNSSTFLWEEEDFPWDKGGVSNV